ncbi:required for meiotic nuclear division protein 1 homolog [Ornithodoros turicata]|uniref:required for meiotic nuclear division protein 1 homolog n=1 Tax=Ornithodoros turicata TaxID=34597 RepID=UPI0031394E6E
MTAKSCILLRTPLKLLFNLCTTSQTFRTARTSLSVAYSTLPLKMRPARKKPVVDEPPSESSLSAVAYSTAGEYDLTAVSRALQKQGLYQQKVLSPDVEEVVCATAKYELNEEHRDLFIFKEGSVVFWNFPELERKSVLHLLKAYEVDSYSAALVEEETESLEYTFHNNKPKFVNGKIFLPSEGSLDLEKYTFSNGMALSVKLAIWEASLDAYVESIECLIEDMKDGRKIRMTRDQLFRKTGELFSLRHLINLSSDLLDTPDFYWDRENLEILYLKVVKYMNIERRTKVMNEKLTHCCELMELLSHHLEDKHHVRLEIMIIVLIMVEVGFECLHYSARFLS